jgi:predicted nucleotidyltransferase
MPSANLKLLAGMAEHLRPVLKEVVFLGGCTTALLITDKGAAEVRATIDVDVIVEAASYLEYVTFSERLRELGFAEDSSPGAPRCRWLIDSMILDVMPTDEEALGFSNRWYPDALSEAQDQALSDDLTIRMVTAPYFVATKLEAFRGRGKDDYQSSRDLEDLIAVVDGRQELVSEVLAASKIKEYISGQFDQLLNTERFNAALPGYLAPDVASQGRADIILSRMRNLCGKE